MTTRPHRGPRQSQDSGRRSGGLVHGEARGRPQHHIRRPSL